MNEASNDLEFPNKRHQKDLAPSEYDNHYFDSWEIHYELHRNEDYPALVKHCESVIEVNPDDIHAQECLGEAYLLNAQYSYAIKKMRAYNLQNPEIEDFIQIILEALFALGKSEDDYDWIIKPKVIHSASEVLDACYGYLHRKRKPVNVEELRINIMRSQFLDHYFKFSALDLYEELVKDTRFVILEDPYSKRWSLVTKAK